MHVLETRIRARGGVTHHPRARRIEESSGNLRIISVRTPKSFVLSLATFDEAVYVRFKRAKASRFLPERGCFAENGVMVLLFSLWMPKRRSVSIPRVIIKGVTSLLDADDCC